MPSLRAPVLAETTITAAAAGQLSGEIRGLAGCKHITALAKFVYGSGGTSVKAWLQTSVDGGTSWYDIACFAFTTSTASKLHTVTVNPATPMTAGSAPSDAALADNTVLNGPIGDRFRLKYTSVGTYAGGTTLAVDAVFKE